VFWPLLHGQLTWIADGFNWQAAEHSSESHSVLLIRLQNGVGVGFEPRQLGFHCI
jgi:hypothetical protein